jgi:hypothetical protein
VDETRVAKIVKATLTEDLGAGLEPNGLAKLDSITCEQLRKDAAERAEHGPPRVDHLQFAVLGEGLGVGREAGGIPPIITGELTCQVAWGLTG